MRDFFGQNNVCPECGRCYGLKPFLGLLFFASATGGGDLGFSFVRYFLATPKRSGADPSHFGLPKPRAWFGMAMNKINCLKDKQRDRDEQKGPSQLFENEHLHSRLLSRCTTFLLFSVN